MTILLHITSHKIDMGLLTLPIFSFYLFYNSIVNKFTCGPGRAILQHGNFLRLLLSLKMESTFLSRNEFD